MKDKKKYIGSMIVLVVLVVLTFYLLLRDNSIGSLIDILGKVNPWFVTLGLLMMLLFVSCEAFNIRNILRTCDRKVSFSRCLKYAFIGFYYSSVTPSATGGQPAQVYYMNKDSIPVSLSSLSLLIIMAVYQTVTLTYGALALIFRYSFVAGEMNVLGLFLIYGAVVNVCLVAGICAMVFSKKLVRRFTMWCARVLHRFHIVKDLDKVNEKIEQQIGEYKRGAEHVRKNPRLLLKVFATVAVQLTALFLVPYFVYKAFGLSQHGVVDIVAVQALLTIAVSSLPLPGAVGASESGFLTLYRLFYTPGVLLPAMLLSRGINFYVFVLISGGVSIAAHVISTRRGRKKEPGEPDGAAEIEQSTKQ